MASTTRPRARRAPRPALERPTLPEFLAASIQTRDGPFTFAGRAPLVGICDALGNPAIRRVDILKATQIGMTTLAGFGYALWETAVNGRNVGYFLPTEWMAREVVGERLRWAVGEKCGFDLGINANDGIARTGRGRIYVRGLITIHGALSVPLDVNLYDEVDDLNPDHFLWARQRLDASHYAREIAFACGRFPGEGMDARFQSGTQHHWHVKCRRCRNADNVLELAFPDCVKRHGEGYALACTRCGGTLDAANGQWVAHYPDRQHMSFRVSALGMSALSLDRLMDEWDLALREKRLMAPFRCSKLALPDAAERQALTAQDLINACAPDAAISRPVYVGVDTGDWCHIAVAEPVDSALVYRLFDRVPGEELVARLVMLASQHRIAGILVDERPEGSLARAVCRAFPRVAMMQQFTAADYARRKTLAGETFGVLSFDREDTLGAWCDHVRMSPPRVLFPRFVEGMPFVESAPGRHILTGAQRMEVEQDGFTIHRFRGGGVDNHYFMACVFAWRMWAHSARGWREREDISLVGAITADAWRREATGT